jgi:hypothetical protein
MRKILGAALAAMLTAGAANATITVTMSGTRSGGNLTGTNATFTLTMIYDELATAVSTTSASSYDMTRYAAFQSMTFSSGSYTQSIQADNSSVNNFDIYNGKTTPDRVFTSLQDATTNGSIRVQFQGLSSLLGSTDMIDVADYAWQTRGVTVSPGTGSNTYMGNITSISSTTSSVPEPGTWGMMLIGFGAVGYAMRRRRMVAVSFG